MSDADAPRKKFLGTRAYFIGTLEHGDLPQFHDGELVLPGASYSIECVDGDLEWPPAPPPPPPLPPPLVVPSAPPVEPLAPIAPLVEPPKS